MNRHQHPGPREQKARHTVEFSKDTHHTIHHHPAASRGRQSQPTKPEKVRSNSPMLNGPAPRHKARLRSRSPKLPPREGLRSGGPPGPAPSRKISGPLRRGPWRRGESYNTRSERTRTGGPPPASALVTPCSGRNGRQGWDVNRPAGRSTSLGAARRTSSRVPATHPRPAVDTTPRARTEFALGE